MVGEVLQQTLKFKETSRFILRKKGFSCLLFAHRKNFFLEKKMLNDEIVDEVKAIRHAYAAQVNYDLRAIYDV
jgi:hypothetical protein